MCEKCAQGYELRDGMCAGKSEFFISFVLLYFSVFRLKDLILYFCFNYFQIIDLLKKNFFPLIFAYTDLSSEKQDNYVTFTRYCLYFGLCVTVCIIFQNSTWLAAVFGVIVALYISFSEYWLKNNPAPKAPSQKILDTVMGME